MGRVDVNRLEEELSPEEFFGWLEYWKKEPFGLPWHSSALSTYYTVAAIGGDPKSDFIEKFLPSYDPAPPMTEAEMAAEFAKLKGR